jgi:sensor histidine kinase YesM
MLSIKEAEHEKRLLGLKALQAQINPHFLYNSLNTIKLLAQMQGANSVVEASNALSGIMQTNMSRREYLTFAEETEYLRKYIALKEYQTADRIRFIVDIEPGLERCYIMKMLLQPLVENALKHGGIMDAPDGYISVRICAEGADVRALVEDNGIGLSEEESRQILAHLKNTESIGLFNITQRLRLHYGEHYGVSISGEKGVYTCVSLLVPRLESLGEPND